MFYIFAPNQAAHSAQMQKKNVIDGTAWDIMHASSEYLKTDQYFFRFIAWGINERIPVQTV